jgi:hypothetical protein
MRTIQTFVDELNLKFPKVQVYDDSFIYTTGKRFHKVWRSRDGIKPSSIYAFVEITTGDIYRAASYNAPANYVRGNINAADVFDTTCKDKYGVTALR